MNRPAATLQDELLERYPCLAGLEPGRLATDLAREVASVDVPAGSVLFEAGGACGGFPLVLEGEVRVTRHSPSGRSMELYRVRPGEVCVFSTAGLLGTGSMLATGTSATRTRLLLVGDRLFGGWTSHAPFREFVFGVFAERLAHLMSMVDALAFQSLDQRLAGYLLGKGHELRTTHQAIADELGTVREIATRVLNRLEAAGHVRLGRNSIVIVDAQGLRALATGTA